MKYKLFCLVSVVSDAMTLPIFLMDKVLDVFLLLLFDFVVS